MLRPGCQIAEQDAGHFRGREGGQRARKAQGVGQETAAQEDVALPLHPQQIVAQEAVQPTQEPLVVAVEAMAPDVEPKRAVLHGSGQPADGGRLLHHRGLPPPAQKFQGRGQPGDAAAQDQDALPVADPFAGAYRRRVASGAVRFQVCTPVG